MKKSIAIFSIFTLFTVFTFSQAVKPKTEKIPVEGHKTAFLYMTELYKSDSWAEFYCTYEEDKNLFDEAAAEKILYEFFSNYKREHGYSSVEVEDLKGVAIGEKKTTMLKRIIFRHVNKR